MPKIKCDCKNPKLISCPKCRKPEKITDKMRLDWLTRQTVPHPMRKQWDEEKQAYQWWAYSIGLVHYKNSPRQAIDAAIKAERDSRKGKG